MNYEWIMGKFFQKYDKQAEVGLTGADGQTVEGVVWEKEWENYPRREISTIYDFCLEK